MSIIGDPLDDYVNKQIEIRQKKMGIQSGRDLEMLSWANSKTAWVKLASGVFLDGDDEDAKKRLIAIGLDVDQNKGTQLPQKYVLFGGISERKKTSSKTTEITNNKGELITSIEYDANYISQQRSTFDQVYDHTDTDFGLVPMPGIESIQVNDKNRGSIKEATVEIVAYSRKQLEILDMLYLKLGYTMLLEWGNSHYVDNNGKYKTMGTTHTERFFSFFSNEQKKQHPKSIKDIDRGIKNLRKSYNGNYDGFIAKVVNFNWTFQPDGSYKITLKLISYGDVVESFKMNLSSKNPEYPDNIQSKSNIVEDFLKLKLLANQGNPSNYITAVKKKDGSKTFGGNIGYFLSGGEIIIRKQYWEVDKFSYSSFIEEKQNIIDTTVIKTIIEQKPELVEYEEGIEYDWLVYSQQQKLFNSPKDFLIMDEDRKKNLDKAIIPTPGAIFDYYFKLTINSGTIDIGGVDKDVFYIDQKSKDSEEKLSDLNDLNNYYIKFQALVEYLNENVFPYINDNQNNLLTKINIVNSRCKYMPNQISFDPRVCIVRAPLNYPNSEKYVIFPELESFIFYQTNNPDEIYGKISNIYLNFGTIIDSINSNLDEKGDVSPLKFLEDLCNKINKAMGGINNLEPRINDDQEIDIIDSSQPSQRINDPQTAIQIYGYSGSYSNFVRNVNLKTEISPEFASMVTIGSTAAGYSKGMEATAFSKWNKGIVDRFKTTITPQSLDSITTEEEVINSYNQYLTSGENKTRLIFIGYSDINNEDIISEPVTIDGELIDTNISVATEFFKYLRAKTYQDNPDIYASTSNGFIPFNMSLTLDGISGIKIYNKIEVDTRFLPYNYPESLKFIVKRVSHKLSNGDWETTIETTVMPGAYSFA